MGGFLLGSGKRMDSISVSTSSQAMIWGAEINDSYFGDSLIIAAIDNVIQKPSKNFQQGIGVRAISGIQNKCVPNNFGDRFLSYRLQLDTRGNSKISPMAELTHLSVGIERLL